MFIKLLLIFLSLVLLLIEAKCKQSLNYSNQRANPLHYNILNKFELIKIPLDGYFPFAKNYDIYDPQSSQNYRQILSISFNTEKISIQKQPQQMFDNQTKVYLNLSRILDIKSIYNQPIKIFLLDKNLIMMYSYSQKQSLQSLVKSKLQDDYLNVEQREKQAPYSKITVTNISAVIQIEEIIRYNLSCFQMETFPLEGGYVLVILCKMTCNIEPKARNYIVSFNMEQDNRGYITNLNYNSTDFIQNASFNLQMACLKNQTSRILRKFLKRKIQKQKSAQLQFCQEYHLKYFEKFVIQYYKVPILQTVIIYCNSSTDLTKNKGLYKVHFQKQKIQILPLLKNPSAIINKFFINSKYVTEYQNGFVSAVLQPSILRYPLKFYKYVYKLNPKGYYETFEEPFPSINIFGYFFITSRNQGGVETIYVIFSDQILIFESYSPNYQNLSIKTSGYALKSYAINKQMLYLHYEDSNSTKLLISAYNIKTMYPYLIDKVQLNITNTTGVYLFSVMNYLDDGKYFFVYEREKNIFKLTYYDGQYVNITVKDHQKAIGIQNIAIINTTSTGIDLPIDAFILPVQIKIRDFGDTSVEILKMEPLKLKSKLFNINLVQAVLGPLGRFYKMPNSLSSLQFVNSFHEIDITEILDHFKGKNLLAFSINTFLNDPILTFYFQKFKILQCDLEFDFQLMHPMITRCVEVSDIEINKQQSPSQIIVYDQGKFIQHEGHMIYFCSISSNRDTICTYSDFENNLIKKIKLISYKQLDEGLDYVSVFIIFEQGFKQKDYIFNQTLKQNIQISVNMDITQNQIEYLKYMTIRTLEYDEGYQKFLIVYMIDYFNPFNYNLKHSTDHLNQSFYHVVQIYSKPQLELNQSSRFVGHLIDQIMSEESKQIENVFLIENILILLFINSDGSFIQQYKINDFKCIKSRNYPLYDHAIIKNGTHYVNSGFLFVQVQELEESISHYLVYNPSLNTTNIITHSFKKIQDQKLLFIQKIQITQNVMLIHGKKLITLSLPNMVIRLNKDKKQTQLTLNQKQKNHNRQLQDKSDQIKTIAGVSVNSQQLQPSSVFQSLQLSAQINVSFVDSSDVLKIISFKYSYDISDSMIEYEGNFNVQLKSFQQYYEIEIDPSSITGPVSEYNIQNTTQLSNIYDENSNLCSFIQFNSSDIFTKTKCLKYLNSKQDGIMQDFLTFQNQPQNDFTIIVTDKKIICLQNMQVKFTFSKDKTKTCNIFKEDSQIFVVCVESNSTIINLLEMNGTCIFNVTPIQKPDLLKYDLFRILISRGQAIFEVPILCQANKVYYITKYYKQNNTFENTPNTLMLLKHQSQQMFITKDFTTNGNLMFLLENGLGIYNISKRDTTSKKLTPDVWISGKALMDKFGLQEDFTYVNCLTLNQQSQQIILQIGTTFHSFELYIQYQYSGMNESASISIVSMTVSYTYKNPWSCYNTLLSKSRYYKNMTIKMCSYMPQAHSIFSNFIAISQNKQNSYMIFYNKNLNKNWSYPFRMDIIYTNIYSNDNFQIPINKAKLLIGSLFNLLCQYDLSDLYRFNFTLNNKVSQFINSQSGIELQKQCKFYLNLSNQNDYSLFPINIKINLKQSNLMYWTGWQYWIQRIFFILLIINFIRLELVKRTESRIRIKSKLKNTQSDLFDQAFDHRVRLNSKKFI